MPLRLEIKKALSHRSERVKCVDIHPTEPWLLAALYSGKVLILDTNTSATVKTFDVSELPVRSAKFIARKQWFMTASDDMQLRVYNYNTMEKVKAWERAHDDYIRFIEVHPTLPYVLTSSDDMTIKLWDWDHGWDCTQVFEGHSHYVMMVRMNPKDSSSFASASLDRTVKVWSLSKEGANFTLDGHERGCNCVDYYAGGDKPYLVSGADDATIRIWDYQTKSCVQVLEGHSNNVSAVCFHPRLPLVVSASEDGTVRLWHSTTYRAETTLNYSMERAWALASAPESNKLAIGFDEGAIVVQLGHEKPIASMDTNTGKLVWAKNNEIQTASLKGVAGEGKEQDGEALPVGGRDLGSCEIFPQTLSHNCNGRFVCVCGDGEYIVYTSQALRNKSFGSALDFCWSAIGTGDYATRESISRVKIFRNFAEHCTVKLPVSSAEGLYGGAMLGVKASDGVVFFDWEDGELVRKIDVVPNEVFWSESGDAVLLACDDAYYVLRCDRDAIASAIATGAVTEDGVDGAFEFVGEYSDTVVTGRWVGECFLYTNASQRLNYYVGGQTMTLAHLDHEMYMLGYLARENRVFLVDKQLRVISFHVLQAMLQYQTAVVREDFDTANELLAQVPEQEYPAVARFLESQGYKEEALQVSTDPDQKFDLAVELERLDIARETLEALPDDERDTTDANLRWKKLGDLALKKGDLGLLKNCAMQSGDLAGLLLLHTSSGDRAGLEALLEEALAAGKMNIAFTAMLLLGRVERCVELLLNTGRFPEAALFSRTYTPSRVQEVLELWRDDLGKVSETAAKALADPDSYPNLFPDLDVAKQVEKVFLANRDTVVPASQYPEAKKDLDLDLIALFKEQATGQAAPAAEEPVPEPESEPQPEPEPEPAAEPEPEPEPELQPQPELQPEPELQPQPQLQPAPAPGRQPQPEEPEPEPAAGAVGAADGEANDDWGELIDSAPAAPTDAAAGPSIPDEPDEFDDLDAAVDAEAAALPAEAGDDLDDFGEDW